MSARIAEVWLPIVGYEGLYEVSDRGRVRSLDRLVAHALGERRIRGSMLTNSARDKGALRVALSRGGSSTPHSVARLVCRAFNGEPPKPSIRVRHCDGDRANNNATNLEWAISQPCIEPDCDRPRGRDDHCTLHRHRRVRGIDLSAPLRRANPRLLDDNGNKWCAYCESWVSLESFHARPRTAGGRAAYCKPCTRLAKHGLTPDEYYSMFNRQRGLCAICPTPVWDGAHIDHDHKCCPGHNGCRNCFRGILCPNCNSGLGYFRDDTENILAAHKYLVEWGGACAARR